MEQAQLTAFVPPGPSRADCDETGPTAPKPPQALNGRGPQWSPALCVCGALAAPITFTAALRALSPTDCDWPAHVVAILASYVIAWAAVSATRVAMVDGGHSSHCRELTSLCVALGVWVSAHMTLSAAARGVAALL